MDVNVFVSSTCRDMADDCRPAVMQAIEIADDILKDDGGRAFAVVMENWDADWEPALQLCLKKIREHSTHYLGLLGYLRGFVPPEVLEDAASITEAELKCAVGHCGREHMAIFVPKDHSPIAVELKRRAAELQSDAELAAQLAFVAQVLHEGAAQQFENVAELNGRVIRKVVLWAKGGIRETARAARPGTGASLRGIPRESDIIQMGRRGQVAAFLDAIQPLSLAGAKKAVAFVIYGPYGFGHAELMTRLAKEVADSAHTQPRRCVISAAAIWRDNSCSGLMDAIARELSAGWRPAETADFTAGLMRVLADRDVVLQVSGLEGYPGGLEGFLTEFWLPLAAEVAGNRPHRLICLASAESEDLALPDGGSPYDDSVRVLPPLRPFDEAEVSFWLKAWLGPPDADDWTAKLMARTRGMPHALYAVLADPALWEPQPAVTPAGPLPIRRLA
jgi:Domain of unknown function (DUF4062)/inactive STAND